jgi:hypothetical protein
MMIGIVAFVVGTAAILGALFAWFARLGSIGPLTMTHGTAAPAGMRRGSHARRGARPVVHVSEMLDKRVANHEAACILVRGRRVAVL